jgi:hypothetical protein
MNRKVGCKSIIILLFLIVVFPFVKIQARSFEGNMYGKLAKRDVNLFIWVDIEIPKGNGIVRGSYFYKAIGKDIQLLGEKRGSIILLTEKDKNHKIIGTFSLMLNNDSMVGYWSKSNSQDSLQVKLYKTNPSFRNTAKLPKLKDLLSEDIDFYSQGLDSNSIDQSITYDVLFARGNLLSIELHWENYSYTAHYGTIHYTYNLSTKEIINLKDEISDSCQAYLSKEIQEIVTSYREEYSDSEWVEGLHPYVEGYDAYSDSSQEYRIAAAQRINDLFTVTSLPEKSEIYLDEDGLKCYIQDYCEQYYSAGNRAMTFNCLVSIPFEKIKFLIKKESILQNLFY